MSKPVKNLITQAYADRFGDVSGGVLVDVRGINANDNNRFRNALATKAIRVTVVKNSLARKAFSDTALSPLNDLIDGPSAIVYPTSEDNSVVGVARELLTWAKELKNLEFKGAVLDGIPFGPGDIEALSKYPTREEAQAQVVQLFLSPAQKLVGAALAPARNIAGILKEIQERLEKGESISKAA